MFEIRRERITLEAILTFAVLIGVTGFAEWARFSPFVYRFAPSFLSVKHGPPAFPVTVAIQESGLKVTNGSSGPWRPCQITVGGRTRYSATFALQPGQQADLPYTAFTTTSGDNISRGYTRAREMIQVRCIDEAGVPHYVNF